MLHIVHIGFCVRNLLFELGLELFLGQTLGLHLILFFLQIILDLVLEHLDIVIKIRLFDSTSVMSQSAHLIRKCKYPLCFYAYI